MAFVMRLRTQGEKDWMKYEVARRLHGNVDKIRIEYSNDWKSKEMRIRQRGVALYFIDKVFNLLLIFSSSLVYNSSKLVYNSSTLVYNNSTLLYNSSTLVYNNSKLVYNSSTLVYNSSKLVYNSSTLMYNSSKLVYNNRTIVS